MNVNDVRVGALDAAGTPIESVYVKNAPLYAIYRTGERVMVHLADAADEKLVQQETLAPLNPIRSEINGLIDGWRKSVKHDKEAMTRLFDRRVADALVVALEGDPDTAQKLLKSTLDEIAEERHSRGRIEHLIFAAGTAAAVALIVAIVSWAWDHGAGAYLDNHVNALLVAGGIGAVGALASIAIAVRERTLTTDLQTRDNVADAVLRVAVGAVGAVLLVAMLRSDLIELGVGNVDLDGNSSASAEQAGADAGGVTGTGPGGTTTATPTAQTAAPGAAAVATTPAPGGAPAPAAGGVAAPAGTAPAPAAGPTAAAAMPAPAPTPPAATTTTTATATTTAGGDRTGAEERPIDGPATHDLLILLVVAFFGGFSERLVRQLAQRINFRDVATDVAAAGVTGAAAMRQASRQSARPTAAAAAAASLPQAAADGGHDPDDDVDGCLADHEIGDDEAADDTQLPGATGGVEDAGPASPAS
jgi:hypothetical protein